MIVAFLAVILPYHPFDYLYNHSFRFLIDKPRVPIRTNQAKFACSLATAHLALVIFLFNSGYILTANVLIAPILLQAVVVGTIDYCVPSIIYTSLFAKQKTAV